MSSEIVALGQNIDFFVKNVDLEIEILPLASDFRILNLQAKLS